MLCHHLLCYSNGSNNETVLNETLQGSEAFHEIKPNPVSLDSVPCPPPWDISLLFSAAGCLNCDQKLQVLYKCLGEWSLNLDCEQILNCSECTRCGLCEVEVAEEVIVVSLPVSTDPTDKVDDSDDEDVTTLILLVVMSCVGSVIVLSTMMVAVWRRRQRMNMDRRHRTERESEENNYDNLIKVKPSIDNNEKEQVLEKLLFPQKETESPHKPEENHPP